ncbi:MAG: phosphatidylinositol-specific phospholipase C/glycerophosphodiester phosphodiesterase family protein [Gemmataceae bacterium]
MAAISLLLAGLVATADEPAPLRRAHAHNDYEHERPLLDALDRGFCSVEADIWLGSDGKSLFVSHTPFGIKPERTLQKLYLDPLRERAKRNRGRIHAEGPPFHLLVDVKTDAKKTCARLLEVLADYADILAATRDGKTTPGAVTVVVSGNCDRDAIRTAQTRFAGIDGRPSDLGSDAETSLIPWISASWDSQFKWRGTGAMPEAEREKLKAFVAAAHKRKRLVRFWAAPDKPEVWNELLNADVDLINTDSLDGLQRFLKKNNTR